MCINCKDYYKLNPVNIRAIIRIYREDNKFFEIFCYSWLSDAMLSRYILLSKFFKQHKKEDLHKLMEEKQCIVLFNNCYSEFRDILSTFNNHIIDDVEVIYYDEDEKICKNVDFNFDDLFKTDEEIIDLIKSPGIACEDCKKYIHSSYNYDERKYIICKTICCSRNSDTQQKIILSTKLPIDDEILIIALLFNLGGKDFRKNFVYNKFNINIDYYNYYEVCFYMDERFRISQSVDKYPDENMKIRLLHAAFDKLLSNKNVVLI